MFTKLFSLAVASVLFTSALGGCAASNSNRPSGDSAAAPRAAAPDGVMCSGCETVWLRGLTDQGTKVQRLSTEKKMVCAECEQMATAYLDKGQAMHECGHCGTTPKPIAPREPSHPKGTHS